MNKGAILMVTLWILAILALLAVGIGFRASLGLKLLSYRMDSIKAYEIAKAGVIKAMNELAMDDTQATDTQGACGISLAPDETQEGKFKDIRVGEGYFEVSYVNESGNKIYGIEDIERKININTASKEVLKKLDPEITDDIAGNIMAWRGEGISGDYSDKAYQCKKALFDVTSELLLVPDVMPETFYDVKDSITVYGPKEGLKININTAGQKALEVILEVSSLPAIVAENIIRDRLGPDGDINTSEGNLSFANTTDVEAYFDSLQGAQPDKTKLPNFYNLITFNSNYFKIRSIGTKSKITKTITCIVKRNSPDEMEIISWREE